MPSFLRIKQILDEAVRFETFGAHGAFWRGLARDQFVAKSIFGRRAIAVRPDGSFDPDESNLVKALEGRAPFGKDVVPRPAGAIWPRMPLGYPPVAPTNIQEIRDWIAAGCPEQDVTSLVWIDTQSGGPLAPEKHNAFWRDFDNWAMFQASSQTEQDVNTFFTVAPLWLSLAGGSTTEAQWKSGLSQAGVYDAVLRLAIRQRDTVVEHYSRPVPLLTLLDSFEKFGDNSLPDDLQRPIEPRHNMNRDVMWFFWSAFIDACLRQTDQHPTIGVHFWFAMARAVLVGALNDGLFRGRFTVSGFSADGQGKQDICQHALSIADEQLIGELMARCRDGGFSL